ncbi:hypothetical protein NIES4075_01620 [Tolypothrix sp. NIES-4075]|nr:hypothetical protein NIES4075_01620 [Tolypothrix sp. NIES-4075]
MKAAGSYVPTLKNVALKQRHLVSLACASGYKFSSLVGFIPITEVSINTSYIAAFCPLPFFK